MELLVVVIIVGLVSAVALPAVLPAWEHRQVSEAGRTLQGALLGARDRAIHYGQPYGIRLVPDATLAGAFSRIQPIGPAPDYAEGLVTVRPAGTLYPSSVVGTPALVLEQSAVDPETLFPNPPTSWFWNVRVGDRVQLQGSGPWYTVAGPMAIGPGSATGNPEMFTNVGPPGQASPLNPSGSLPIEYLLLTDGRDDDGDGWVDEGWDGVDNNGNGRVDEHLITAGGIVSEWEAESWEGQAAHGLANVSYAIRRRPLPLGPEAPAAELPTHVVVDAARSRLPIDPRTGLVEVLIDPDGTARPSLPYGPRSSLGMDAAFLHFALVERPDVAPAGTSPLPAPKGEWSVLTLSTRTGRIASRANPDPADPFADARAGIP